MILVDTNILLRIAQAGHPHGRLAYESIKQLTLHDRERFAVAPQVLYEMDVAYTRPVSSNGFGYTSWQAADRISATRAIFELLPETPGDFHTWERLVTAHQVVGKQAHDARLVAIMIEHQIRKLLTFNNADFLRYEQIQAINPLAGIDAA